MGKLMIASLTMATASVAWASVPVGTPVGAAVGVAVGDVLGQITGLSFGAVLPGSGLLVVAAVSLAVGARIARRKQQRKNNESHV